MKKELQRYGDANIIRISPKEMKWYDLKTGELVEVNIKKIKKEVEK